MLAMSRKGKNELRCRSCKMHRDACICSLVEPIETHTRVVLVIHRREARKPTNTGLLAAACLANSRVVLRGDEAPSPLGLPDGQRVLLLYPADDAIPIDRVNEPGPFTLVVPDGNWRQAGKVRTRVPELRAATCVTLPQAEPSAYQLRAEPHPRGLATLEAIARALEILEGPAVREHLERPFHAMVERTLRTRGIRD